MEEEEGVIHLAHLHHLDLNTPQSEVKEDKDKGRVRGSRLDKKKVVRKGLWLFLNSLELLGGGSFFLSSCPGPSSPFSSGVEPHELHV